MPKGSVVTRELFQTVQQLREIYPDYGAEQIAGIVKREATVIRLMFKMSGWEEYENYKKEKAEKQRAREEKRKAAQPEPAEEEVPGQIRMDLTPAEEHEETLGDMQTKMMRFQAEMAGKIMKKIEDQTIMINSKLDQLNDTLHMILRAVRKE